MKLKLETKTLLTNYSTIGQGIIIKKDEPLMTMSEGVSIIAKADNDTFPKGFAIYNLMQFLSVISIFNEPNLEFYDDYLEISGDNSKAKIKYYYADEDCLPAPPANMSVPEAEYELDISAEEYVSIQKVAGVMQLPDFVIKADGDKLKFGLVDEKNDLSNNYFVEVGDTKDVFSIYFKQENLKLLPYDYRLSISKPKGDAEDGPRMATFVNEKRGLTYFMALESKSTFGG